MALAPLAVGFAAMVAWVPWRSNFDIDSTTRFVQIISIAQHGSAGYDNGPVEGNPELTPRWMFPAHGRAWGPYPVLGDGVLAIGARLDGFRGVIRTIWLLFAGSCAIVYALTYRLTRRPAIAVAAAYSLSLGTSSGFWGTMVAPFVPAGAFWITGLYFLSRSFAATTPWRSTCRAAAGGVFATLALGSHLVGAAAWALVALACLLFSTPGARLVRPLAYLVGSAPGLAIMTWVNHIRFGVSSPFSYGPCDTFGCLEATVDSNSQNGRAFFDACLPYVPYVVAFALVCWWVRRSWIGIALLVFVASVAALIPNTPGGGLFRNVARTLWATLFDTGNLDMGYPKWGDDPGVFSFWMRIGLRIAGPWAVRSVFQCSPILIAALLPLGRGPASQAWGARVPRGERLGTYAVLVAACCGVLTVMLMRANLPGGNSLGMPFLNYRYVVTVLPALTVLAAVAVAELPLRLWHVAVAVAVAVSGSFVLSLHDNDEDLLRRQVTHWLPLALAFGGWASVLLARVARRARYRRVAGHVAALIAAIMVGYGPTITLGVDRVVAKIVRGVEDRSAEEVRRCTPKKFILVGAAAMSESLGALDEKQIHFMDPLMGPRDGSNVNRMLLEEISPDNPAFLMDEAENVPWIWDWPGLKFEKIPGCPRVRRILRTEPPPEPPAGSTLPP
jgi:hypothetical protein